MTSIRYREDRNQVNLDLECRDISRGILYVEFYFKIQELNKENWVIRNECPIEMGYPNQVKNANLPFQIKRLNHGASRIDYA